MLAPLLSQRADANTPIRVGIIGTGKFGSGLVAQVSRMRGMVISAIADINQDRAIQAYTNSDVDATSIRCVRTPNQLDDAIKTGHPCVTEDGLLLTACDQLDVIVEATGLPEVGARMAYETLHHNKHLVMVNVETDVTIGPLLRRLADSAGVVYSLVDGDQPGCTMNLIDWAQTLGFEIIAAGRGTIYFADDFSGTPDSVPQRFGFDEATIERRSINLKMYNSFRDGTKAQVEMTALANMAGLHPDVRGMHEPSVNICDIASIFSHQGDGGILSGHGVVELANSIAQDGSTWLDDPLRMGVFVVIRSDHPFTREDLATYDLHPDANHNNFLLYRPYHLVAVEAPITIAQAALYGQPTGTPLPTPTAEVITVAKSDLKAGQTLDGGGGYTVNGLCEKAAIARQQDLLPLGLSAGACLKTDIAKGTAITYAMVDLKEDSFVLQLRRLQDATVW